jgi:hypothetical protein
MRKKPENLKNIFLYIMNQKKIKTGEKIKMA